jgi:D-arginine dehydrogenase
LGCELARDHDVCVLEAERALATHSTGRSAALFLQGYGPEVVQALTRASAPLFAALEHDHDRQLLLPRGAVLTAWEPGTAAGLGSQLQTDPNLEELTAQQVGDICPVVRTDGLLCAAIDRNARDIDVMGLYEIFVTTMRRRGGRTVTSARLVSAQKSSTGWTATTEDGRQWTADVLVNAAGAWGDRVAQLCNVTGHELTPRRRTVVIARTTRDVDPAWPVVADAGEEWYFKPEGGAVLLSPGDETPAAPGDAKPEPVNVATALARVNAISAFDMKSVQSAWAGLRTFARDRVPVVPRAGRLRHPDGAGAGASSG